MEVTMKRIEMMMRGLGAGLGAPHRHCDCLRPRLQTTNNSLKLWVAWRHRVSALHYLTKHKQRRGSTALASARLHPAACACACGPSMVSAAVNNSGRLKDPRRPYARRTARQTHQ